LSDKLYVVLDTSALLAKYYMHLDPLKTEIYTVKRAVDEVKDSENREALEVGLSIGRVRVIEPRKSFVERVLRAAWEVGERAMLSVTDVEVAALALEFKERGFKVLVITDDYALQNLLLHLNIAFKPLRTTGIRRPRKYVVACSVCGYVSADPSESLCPVCGNPLSRRRASTSS